MTAHSTNVFSSVEDYLNPLNHPPTPCVRLPASLNPYVEDGVEIWAKLAFANPLFQSKWFAAHGLLSAAKRKGRLKGVHTIVDNSSGNTALGLVALAKHYNIRWVVMTVPLDMPASKTEILELLGCEVRRTTGGIEKSREMGETDDWFCTSQYHNTDNPDGFAATLGEQLYEQFGDRLTVGCASLGTSGTVEGSFRKYRNDKSRIFTVVGAVPTVDQVPGTRSFERLKEIGLDWESAITYAIDRSIKESYRMSLRLCREGILAGPSSGLALAALLEHLRLSKENKTLAIQRNQNKKVVAVFICPDTLLPYLEKYTTHLEPEDLAFV